jgi:hypothetical protein
VSLARNQNNTFPNPAAKDSGRVFQSVQRVPFLLLLTKVLRVSLLPPPAPSSRPNPHYTVSIDSGFVRLVRSAARFDTKEQVEEARLWVSRQLDSFGRKGRNLLVDSRLAPPSTDFLHGAEFCELRREIERGFTRIAVLVQTKLGVLQARRIASEDKSGLMVFEREQDAVAYVMGLPTNLKAGLAKRPL